MANAKLYPKIHVGSAMWDLLHPEDSIKHICIEDIARSLSRIARFVGHTNFYYCVGQHSVLCSYNGRDFLYDKLMHDAAEAILNDVASPLKQMMPEYKAIEHATECVVFDHFAVSILSDAACSAAVRHSDISVLFAEKRDVVLPVRASFEAMDKECWGWHDQSIVAGDRIRSMTPTRAYHSFLKRFYELCPDAALHGKDRKIELAYHDLCLTFGMGIDVWNALRGRF